MKRGDGFLVGTVAFSALWVSSGQAFTLSRSFSAAFVPTTATTVQTRVQWNSNKGGRHEASTVTFTATSTKISKTQLFMFDQLSQALASVASSLGPKPRMTEASIQPALKQVRRALLDADVNVQVADTLIAGVRQRSLGQAVLKGVTAEQQFIKAMYDELLDIMGGSGDSGDSNNAQSTTTKTSSIMPAATLATGTVQQPAVILLAGLQGAGKTTAAGKLALYLQEREVDYDAAVQLDDEQALASRLPKRQRKVLLVAADVYRPAAIEQLQILGASIGVPVFALGTDVNPVTIVQEGLVEAKRLGCDTVIVDTAGRQVIDVPLMNELRNIQKACRPAETLLIVDAMTGQEAATLTAAFHEAVGLTGAILTKMDGDARGGAAVSVRAVSGQPIKLVGTGERVADLEPFYPDRMASRILGMGDVVSLVEKAAAAVSDADALAMQQKMKDATFDFDDFLKQTELLNQMGSVANIAKMMPGMGGNQISASQLQQVEIKLKQNRAFINSMSPKERKNPDLLISDKTARSRLMRITKGSGLRLPQGQQFVSEFQRMRTIMSRMQKQMGGMDAMDSMANMEQADSMPALGNRAMRRNAKKSKGKRSGGGGFG
jgi:signal recognition particle subunit SRP54